MCNQLEKRDGIGVWDSVLIENMNESSFLDNLHKRFSSDLIFTYIGTHIISINPNKRTKPFSNDLIKLYEVNNLFRLPPHIYGFANYIQHCLKSYSEEQCIIHLGEIGSGKTTNYQSILSFIIKCSISGFTYPSGNPFLNDVSLDSLSVQRFSSVKSNLSDISVQLVSPNRRQNRLLKSCQQSYSINEVISDKNTSLMNSVSTKESTKLTHKRETHHANLINLKEVNSGKKENMKLSQRIRERIAFAEVILSSFGNVSLSVNNNSSRFGKFIDLNMDFKAEVQSAHYICYMLEKWRINGQRLGEGNFHIFYYLLRGGDMHILKALKLTRNITEYKILNNKATSDGKSTEQYESDFISIKKSLFALGLSTEQVFSMFMIIAAILKLGNLIFIPMTNLDGSPGCEVSNEHLFQDISSLLSIDHQLFSRCFMSDDSDDCSSAYYLRDCLMRTLYERLFIWLVQQINRSIKGTEINQSQTVGLLDFFGFENWNKNRFETLAINYCNEKIQQHYLQLTFKQIQEVCNTENFKSLTVDFNDNQTVCDLFDNPSISIFSILSNANTYSYTELISNLEACSRYHENFHVNAMDANEYNQIRFQIRHFDGVLPYSISDIVQKNYDSLPNHITVVFHSSKSELVKSFFPDSKRKSTTKNTSVTNNLRNQLVALLDLLRPRRTHFVFCINPNKMRTNNFELAEVQNQIRYLNLYSLAVLLRNGYYFNMKHLTFYNRYKILYDNLLIVGNKYILLQMIKLIISQLPLPAAEFYIGPTMVFIRSPRATYELEMLRLSKLNYFATVIQRNYRCYRCKRVFNLMKQSQITISRAWRHWKESGCFINRHNSQSKGRKNLWSLYNVAKEEYKLMQYRRRIDWAIRIIQNVYIHYKIRQLFSAIIMKLSPETMSPLNDDWPEVSNYFKPTSTLLKTIFHRWRCYRYRISFDTNEKNRMREKVTASLLFKDRKAMYQQSVSHPFVGDYVRIQRNSQWARMVTDTDDRYLVFADFVYKISRTTGRLISTLVVISTEAFLILDPRTLQIKFRLPATEIYRISLSPYEDDIFVLHIKASEATKKKGDLIFKADHVIEIVTKLFLIIQNATNTQPHIQISPEFEACFKQQTVFISFKNSGGCELNKVIRKANRIEIVI